MNAARRGQVRVRRRAGACLGLLLLLALAAALLSAPPAQAVFSETPLADPAQEARARALMQELRCLVCQNQPISDSNAPLARDLRMLLRERIRAGDSDSEIRDFMVARYGDWVLLQPPLRGRTMLLWLGPVGILLVGGLLVFLFLRRAARLAPAVGEAAPLTEAERAELARALTDRD